MLPRTPGTYAINAGTEAMHTAPDHIVGNVFPPDSCTQPLCCLLHARVRPLLALPVIIAAVVLLGCGGEQSAVEDAATTSEGSTAETGDGEAACERYLKCVSDAEPAELADAVVGYGPAGTCWDGDPTLCEQACASATSMLWEARPAAHECAPCREDHECPPDTLCSEAFECVACADDSDCELGRCSDSVCVECIEGSDCQSGVCTDQVCMSCSGSADCPDGHDCTAGVCLQPLFPLGNATWDYRFTKTGTGDAAPFYLCQDTETVESTVFAGYTRYNWYCAGPSGSAISSRLRRGEGDEVLTLLSDGTEAVFIDMQLEEGHEWTGLDGVSLRWLAHTQVSVPAGEFDDCWVREADDGATRTFCRGVGLVRAMRVDSSGDNGFVAELLSYDPK